MPGFTLFFSLTAALFGLHKPATNGPGAKPAAYAPAEKIIQHKLGDKTISFKVIQYGQTVKTCCVNVHDNEATAVTAARAILEQEGGILVKIENNAQRMVSFSFKGAVYTFDPNRIFSEAGIKQTLKCRGKINPLAFEEVAKFAEHFLQLIPDTVSCVIALHNNTDGDYSVKTYEKGGQREHDAKQVYADNWQDVDDIAFTTDDTLYTKMSEMGYNSILQDNANVFKDGSLSVFYGEQNKRYINIETQFGKTKQYKEMLGKLLYFLEEEKKPVVGQTDVANLSVDSD